MDPTPPQEYGSITVLAVPFPRGHWLYKTHAQKKYALERSELERLVPISSEWNPRGPGPIKRYNEFDVVALRDHLQAKPAAEGFTAVAGGQIHYADAREEYDLGWHQIRRIRPTSVWKDEKGKEWPVYNLKDVVDFAESLAAALESLPPQQTYKTSQPERAAEKTAPYEYRDDVAYTLDGDPHPEAHMTIPFKN